jgi:hypothetical protein
MKIYRVATLLAAALITVILTWALWQEQVGAREQHLIEAAAP